MSRVRIHENDQVSTADSTQAALKRLAAKYALNESELEYLEDGETVLWDEGDETVEIVLVQGE